MAVDDDKSLTGKVSDNVLDDDAAGETPSDDEHVVPPGADEDIQLAHNWVAEDEPSEPEQEQREAGGYR